MYLDQLTRRALGALLLFAAATSLRGDEGVSAESLLELSRMSYGLVDTYEDMGRMTVEPDKGGEAQQFLFRTHFSRRGPFRYEFRGETHPELILIRSDGRLTGFYWSAENEELPVAGPYEAVLRAGPLTNGIARWVPQLLFADQRSNGLLVLDCRTAELVSTVRGSGGEALYELLLDAGTPLERSLWIDGTNYLILRVETRRTTEAGSAVIRAIYQPKIDQQIPWEMFTQGALPLHGEDSLVEVREQGQLSRVPAPDEVLAVVFGMPMTLRDVYPDGVPSEDVLRRELGSALGRLVFADVMSSIIEGRNYDIPQDLLNSYVMYRFNFLRQNLQKVDETLAQSADLEPQVIQQLQAYRARLQAMLNGNVDELSAQFAREGMEMIRLWQFNREVYARYGGQVIHSQTGPEPIGAYRELIRDQIDKGRVQIRAADLEEGFWSVFEPDLAYEIPSSQVSFDRPWWVHGVVSMPQ